jgi:hypothetical protein
MMLRAAAALALAAGILGFGVFLHVMGLSPTASLAARHLRAMKDRLDPPASVAPMTFADFAALPHARPVAEYSALERRGASLEGYVQRMILSSDGDYHLEIAPRRRRPGWGDTAYVSAEITPQWQRGSSSWRFGPLLAALRPNFGGATSWDDGPRRVRISGWLLYDFQYDPGFPVARALAGTRRREIRITGWEIHPATRIEIWNDSLDTYEDYPR